MMQPKKLFVCAVLSKHQAPHPFSLRHGVLLTCVLTLIYLSFSFWQAKWTQSMSEPLLWIVGKRLASAVIFYLSSFQFFSSDQDLTQKKVLPSHPVRLPVFVTHVRLCFSSRVSFFPLTSSSSPSILLFLLLPPLLVTVIGSENVCRLI